MNDGVEVVSQRCLPRMMVGFTCSEIFTQRGTNSSTRTADLEPKPT
jgi:hypothetical protein